MDKIWKEFFFWSSSMTLRDFKHLYISFMTFIVVLLLTILCSCFLLTSFLGCESVFLSSIGTLAKSSFILSIAWNLKVHFMWFYAIAKLEEQMHKVALLEAAGKMCRAAPWSMRYKVWVEFWHCNLTFMWHLLFKRKLVFRFRDEETL